MAEHPETPEPGLSVGIVDGAIVIRLPFDTIGLVVEGAWAASGMDGHWRVTDVDKFAPEVVRALVDENEDGTTIVHRLFDRAFSDAIEQGAEGVEKVGEDDDLTAEPQ